ncbi:hypothetical protein H7F51_11615 [Novosphingobium flavum]|uniref:DUF7847 domain-containing protein n=1 Tax=Novosphingobium flavum TaxID=1778672 RepID=A0A7X1KMC3_9SPHN|nr:hypothetical protein [Novosphingobium flavum]MBC2666165.1 hypothetical protein [Novosphingobium flavum]
MTRFSIRAVLGRTFSIIGKSLTSVGVLIIGTQSIMMAIQFAFIRPMMMNAMAGPDSALGIFSSGTYWFVLIASFGLFSILFASATHGFLITGEGKRAEFADCLRTGIYKALPVFALMLLWALGVWVGMILLIVPGLILMTMWSVSLPSLVSGDSGVIGSFGRSRELTKGSRWKIFALILLFAVVYYVLYFTLMGAVVSGVRPGELSAAMAASMSPAMLAGSLILTTVMLFLFPALLTSIYLETTRGRAGSMGEPLEEVFA